MKHCQPSALYVLPGGMHTPIAIVAGVIDHLSYHVQIFTGGVYECLSDIYPKGKEDKIKAHTSVQSARTAGAASLHAPPVPPSPSLWCSARRCSRGSTLLRPYYLCVSTPPFQYS